jgi:tetratricopeptide (TPR) repeat protein
MKDEYGGERSGKSPTRGIGVETLVLVSVVCLLVGFIGGMAFKAYRVGSSMAPESAKKTGDDSGQAEHIHSAMDIEEIKAIATANPNSAEAWRHLGDAYFDTDQYEDAILAYEKSLGIDASNADVWTDLGVMYHRSKSPQKAVEAFEKASELDPVHQISRFNKGVVLLHDLNDPEGAVRAWEELLKINPGARAPDGTPVKEIIKNLKKR